MHDEPPLTKVLELKHVNKLTIQPIFQHEKVVYLKYVAQWLGGRPTICP